ncbi:Fur family transcriptional regulator [Pseudomonas abyssi]|jgi:Fur family zinc uptake transcriptional regulator|uniref:Fur family transcriptional regulator n=1 Tax=Pseudomonas abyssi TaxID=170540 RepID=A0A2A3MGU2_9PSED|nr:Fur family transcriptional regulator [Pseudomonas abyssi]MAD01849.1 transcriptional repressor [Pseudomonadales bacterium]PBK03774.1 Fur family transcriptional regulator [Pseudomonas abyssi]|tara:strand:+ start:17222 stop:17716 length:495 start_codon:yes stop_codon:yes gene_type:complete
MSHPPHLSDPQAPHNHDHCVSHALQAAEQVCTREGVRFTALRKRVLELVWQSHKPLGAYDILDTLSRDDGRRAAPPTVYRALDFLQEQGLVHRIASLNAFIGCPSPEHRHQGYFLICLGCHVAIELEESGISEAIASAAAAHDFVASSETVEVSGLCARCRAAA